MWGSALGVAPRLFPASPRGSAAAPRAIPRRRASALRSRARREQRAQGRQGRREGGGGAPRSACGERRPSGGRDASGRAGGRACRLSVHRCRCFMRVGGRAGGTRLCPRCHSPPIPPAERPARTASPTALLSPGSFLSLLCSFAVWLSPDPALVGGCRGAGGRLPRGPQRRLGAATEGLKPTRHNWPARPGSARPGSAHPARRPRSPLGPHSGPPPVSFE